LILAVVILPVAMAGLPAVGPILPVGKIGPAADPSGLGRGTHPVRPRQGRRWSESRLKRSIAAGFGSSSAMNAKSHDVRFEPVPAPKVRGGGIWPT